MARPISWLPFVRDLHRSVVGSVRDVYTCSELESLFNIQSRSAQKLMEMMPRIAVGSSFLVKKDDLGIFLERVRAAEDVPKLFAEIRANPPAVTRQKIRSFVRRDVDPAQMASMPDSMTLRRGHLAVNFKTRKELCEAMIFLASILESDGFATTFCGERPMPVLTSPPAAGEVTALFDELEQMESEYRAKVSTKTETTQEQLLAMPSIEGVDVLPRIPHSPPYK